MVKSFKIAFLIIIGILISQKEIHGQRVFAPSEDGFMVEILPANDISRHNPTLMKIKSYPKFMETIIPVPCKIYIYEDDGFDEDEIKINQIYDAAGWCGWKKDMFDWKKSNKSFDIKKIGYGLYEITLHPDFLKNTQDYYNKLAISYDPSKNSKKNGKTRKHWLVNLSTIKYKPSQINSWSNEQAFESIHQLVSEGETTEQLFASIKPVQTIANGQQIQYVVVQNQPAGSTQDNNQNIQNEEKEEIISDIDKNVPYRDINNENTFALIIANEDYNKVAPVNFAKRDGQKISEYLKKTLGIGKDHIAYLENATLNDMRYEVNRLSKISDAYNGEASFIIYYIGHGIPDEKNGNGYLLPVDGYGNDVSTAYPLADLYSQLSNLEAKKIVLFTDACFSGANKSGDMLVAARGIAIRSNPNEAKGHLIAFSACQGDETAYSYDEQGHGLLTYYFLKKLKETGGQTTLGELEEYIVDNVGKTAIIINGKSQTPRVSVSPELQETWKEITFYE